jgi:putative membrane protein
MIAPVPLAASAGIEAVVQLIPLAALGLLYALRTRALAGGESAVPRRRRACFWGGLALIALAVTPPANRLGAQLLCVNTVEHLLIGQLGPLAIVLGLTGPLTRPLRAIRPLAALRLLVNPVTALALWAGVTYGWRPAGAYQASLQHTTLHALQHATLLAAGVCVWLCLFGPLATSPRLSDHGRAAYVLLLGVANAVLANMLLWSGVLIYPSYLSGDAAWHLSPLADQNIAGAAMLIETTLLTLGLLCWLLRVSALRARSLRQQRELAELRALAAPERPALRATVASARPPRRRSAASAR